MAKRLKKRNKTPRADKPYSIRLPNDLRKQLERFAAEHRKDGHGKKGWDLSQEIIARLNNSMRPAFAIQKQQDPRLPAIFYLVGQVTLFTGEDWKTDPWMFQAFKVAVFALLDKMKPPGDPKPTTGAKQVVMRLAPETPSEQLENIKAEGFGLMISDLVWNILTTAIRPPAGVDAPSGSWPYAMPQAREELGIDFDVPAFAAILRRITTDNDGGVK
jgi:hypothetical protein